MPYKSNEKGILLATILASGLGFLDSSIVGIAIPVIQSEFKSGIGQMQWVANGFLVTLAAFLLIGGALGDRFGRKKVFAIGIGVFTIASLLCSMAGSALILIIARALQGVGAAIMIPGSLAIINTAFEAGSRGRAIGLWAGFSGGIASLGPFLGGWLVQRFGWRSIFYINLPLGILALLLALRFIPESRNPHSRKLDFPGTVLILVSLAS